MPKRALGGITNNGQRLRGVGTPTAADDGVPKSYVDGLLGTKDVTGFRNGRWYSPLNMSQPTAGVAQTANTLILVPALIKRAFTLSQLAALVTTGVSGAQVQFAVYAHNFTANGPGALLSSSEAIIASGTGQVVTQTMPNTAISEGLVWLGVAFTAASVLMSCQYSYPNILALIGNTAPTVPGGTGNGSQSGCLAFTNTFGSLPADLSGTTGTIAAATRAPFISMQAGADS